MTDAGAASASATRNFDRSPSTAPSTSSAWLDDGVLRRATDGAESQHGSTLDLNNDRRRPTATVCAHRLAGLRGGDGATFTLKHLHDGGRQLEGSVQRWPRPSRRAADSSFSDVTGERLPRARGARARAAAAAAPRRRRRARRGPCRARPSLKRARPARRRARADARGGAGRLDELNRNKRRIEQLDGALRRWEERGADDRQRRRTTQLRVGRRRRGGAGTAVAAAAPAAAGPSGVAPQQTTTTTISLPSKIVRISYSLEYHRRSQSHAHPASAR